MVKIQITDPKPKIESEAFNTPELNEICDKVVEIIATECRNLGQMISASMAITAYICTTSLQTSSDAEECDVGLQCIVGGLNNMIDNIKENSIEIIAKKLQDGKINEH